MIRTRLAVLAVVAGMLLGSAAFAADEWNSLDLGASYSLNISEFGSGSGTIKQFDGVDMAHSIAVTGGVLYSLPSIAVVGASPTNPFWGVCIDTHEWSTSPQGAVLRQGWAPGVHSSLGTAGRLNGTVLNEIAWQHTTYLFSQFGAGIGAMTLKQKAAFQLATWEVMSGDGSAAGGGVWDPILTATRGNFTATNVKLDLLSTANDYVKAAYIGFDTNWSSALANGAFYFSGVKNNNTYQDYLVYAPVPSDNTTPDVPEIPAVALGPLGLMALGLIRRRFVK